VQGYGDDRAVEERGEGAEDEDAGEFADGGVEAFLGHADLSRILRDDASLKRAIG
jgi:hypothetical protein